MAKTKDSFKTKAFRAGGYSTAAAAIIIVIAVVANLIVSNISTAYTNFDTTEAKLYSLSQQTKDIVSSLEKEVTIYYYASEDAKANYVSNLLEKFEKQGKNLSVENIDPDTNPDFISSYTDESVADGDLLVVCGDKTQVVHYDEMIEYEAGSYDYYYYYYYYYGEVTDIYWNGEVLLIKAIDYVSADKTYTVYFYDTDDAGDYTELEELLVNENIVCATLSADTQTIPEDADCVIITSPSEDLTQEQSDTLIKYLDNSGKIYVDTNYSDDEMPNLDSVLEYFGLSFTSATIEDGDRNFGSNEYLLPEFASEHSIVAPFTSANYILLPDAMGIEVTETDSIAATTLLETSESAYLSTDDSDALNFNVFTLGVFAENTETGAQIVVYGSSDYTTSTYTDDASLSNNDLFINSVGYLCDKDSAVTVHAKSITSDTTLDFSNTSTELIVFIIAVVPTLLAIATGFSVWYKRRNS